MATHRLSLPSLEYGAIILYDIHDWMQLLRPIEEKYEVGDILQISDSELSRCCWRRVSKVSIESESVVLNLETWFGEVPEFTIKREL